MDQSPSPSLAFSDCTKNSVSWPTTSQSIIEINKTFLHHNIQTLHRLSSCSQLGIVIKSDAYGHGMLPVASILEHIPEVTWLCTVGIEEAVIVRQAGSRKRLLSMAYIDMPLKEAISNSIDVTVDDEAMVRDCNIVASRLQQKIRVHLKIDTGLSRLGSLPGDVLNLVGSIKKNYKWVDLFGVFTHLADTNNPDQEYTYRQLAVFDSILTKLKNSGYTIPFSHALSSGGLTLSDKGSLSHENENNSALLAKKYSMIRIGTNAYGLYKSDIQRDRLYAYDPTITLKPLLTWKSRIVEITGEHYLGESKSRRAVIPVGFADGYPSILVNKACVSICGKNAPVRAINSDFMLVDISNNREASVGSQAILIGDLPGITASELAIKAQTINNEFLTRISPHIERRLID